VSHTQGSSGLAGAINQPCNSKQDPKPSGIDCVKQFSQAKTAVFICIPNNIFLADLVGSTLLKQLREKNES